MAVTIHETDDIAACIALRIAVFVDEQGITVAEELDDLDDAAVHFIAVDEGRPVGTCRILMEGDTGRVGRICVLASHRGTGLGARLVQTGVDALSERGFGRIRLGAQSYAIPFYEKLGFSVIGPEYDDAGIPHREMERLL